MTKKYVIEVIQEGTTDCHISYPAMSVSAALCVVAHLVQNLIENSDYGEALVRELVEYIAERCEKEGSMFNELN